jgi:PncC family amidohydrolase
LIGHLVTEIAGSSAYYRGGAIVYSNDLKQQLLDVPATTLATHGAVSEPTARAMAEGARARLHADVGLATTGIAGPGGGTPTKPVGLVFIAVATPTQLVAQRHLFNGDRASIKQQTARAALQLVLDSLQ